ncbi:uncharacterized protein LOC141771878 isoform X2 [Sebastes fasciatus]|uniref:uncharacterized protein LOC141771878 isoform X1 n=1 Tax=Sebastes fasciatus TaxID=394691 RepID=UPI003D9EA962
MENCGDHDHCRVKRARKPAAHRQCTMPCCRDDQVYQHSASSLPRKRKRTSVARPSKSSAEHPKVVTPQPSTPAGDSLTCVAYLPQVHQHSAPPSSSPRKRKRTSVARPSESSADHPKVVTPQPSGPAGDMPGLLGLAPRPCATIPPSELPAVSKVTPDPKPFSAPLLDDGPLLIHNRTVEEYQRIYHEVVDDMLRFKNGRPRPYSLDLGRRIKQKLWERLDRPTFTSSVGEDGLVRVEASYGVGVYPPMYDVDTLGEPQPSTPPTK